MNMYFFDSIKKTIVAFSKQFSAIEITRRSSDGTVEKNITVELIYANKSKFYKKVYGAATTRQQVVLPAMSLWNTQITPRIDKQGNPLAGRRIISKDNNDYAIFMKNPVPVEMTFSVLIKTIYYTDMLQILETIIPSFNTTKTLSVNLIPEMNDSFDITIILSNISQDFVFESDETLGSDRSLETELTFTVHSWIFPPLEEKYVAKYIKLYTEAGTVVSEDNMSPDSIIDDKILNLEAGKTYIKNIEYNHSDVSDIALYKILVSDVIATNTEKFRIEDTEGNSCPFVFEYDNGESYGCDDMVPSFVTGINKTGYIYVKGIHSLYTDKPTTYGFLFYSYHHNNFQYPQAVIPQYDDFNTQTLQFLHVERLATIEKLYIDSGKLYLKSYQTTVPNIQKVYPKLGNVLFNSYKFGLKNFVHEKSKIICGMSREDDTFLTIQTSSTTNEYILNEYYSGADHILSSTTIIGSITSILFQRAGSVISVYLNGTLLGTSNKSFEIPFMSGNFSSYIQYDYFIGQ